MAVETITDKYGTEYYIPDVEPMTTRGGAELPGSPSISVWWNRLHEEKLMIRQETENDRADVIELTLGQAYDLIEALNRVVENI